MAWLILCILVWVYVAIRLVITIKFCDLPFLDFDVIPMIIWLITTPLLIWLILITPFEFGLFAFLFMAGHCFSFWYTFFHLDLKLMAWMPVFIFVVHAATHWG